MPRIIYKNSEGKRIQSVTTILGNLGWNKDALMYWAWNEGIEGRDYKESRDKAASIGTIAHGWIEADIKEEEFNINAFGLDDKEIDMVTSCHDAYLEWKAQTRLKLIESEVSLVSEEHQIGGTLDCVGYVFDRKSLLDLKTASGIYEDMILQLAGYCILWRENRPEHPLEEIHILRLGKEDASFTHRMVPIKAMGPAFDAFIAAIKIHRSRKAVRKLT